MAETVRVLIRAIRSSIKGRPWPVQDLSFARTDFLVAQPSFWSGVGRTIDLAGAFDDYIRSATPAIADAKALYADWRVIGQDLNGVVHTNHPNFIAQPTSDDTRNNVRVTAQPR